MDLGLGAFGGGGGGLGLGAGDGEAAAEGDGAAAAELDGGGGVRGGCDGLAGRGAQGGGEDIGIVFAAAATELLGEAGEEFFEGAQVGGAAEEVVEDLVADGAHQGGEELVGLGFVFDEGVFLGELAEVDAVAEGVHVVEVFLPEAVDGVEEDVAFEAFEGFGVLGVGFEFVGGLDLVGDPGGVILGGAGFEGGGFAGEAEGEGEVEPLEEAVEVGVPSTVL